jgi:hypothetical protein
MTMMPNEGRDRRRHFRQPGLVACTLVIGEPVPVARLIDVSVGGVLLELPRGFLPPALHASGTALLTCGASSLQRHAKVVRVRWSGREKGEPTPPAIALSFDDADLETAMRWERMITA